MTPFPTACQLCETKVSNNISRRILFYTNGIIAPFGSGSAIRQYTNLRAYTDLGFNVEVIQFIAKARKTVQPELDLPIEEWTTIDVKQQHVPLSVRIAYYIGLPKSRLIDAVYPIRKQVIAEVKARESKHPCSIHHFEYINMASAAIGYKGLNSVWSCLDIFSIRNPMLWMMRGKANPKNDLLQQKIRSKRIRLTEDLTARDCSLILNIAQHEHDEFRINRNYVQAELFPMSCADEVIVEKNTGWMANGKLHLLHLGSIGGFIGYESLRYIFQDVFPLIPQDKLASIELVVAGKIGDTAFDKEIQQLASRFSQVKFLGFVDDIRKLYATVDLQVVGGERASGLRTRIVESFAYGIPVLSSWESAKGVVGLNDGVNVLLAKNPYIFASHIVQIMQTPRKLSDLRANARATYDQYYNRQFASQELDRFLREYLLNEKHNCQRVR